MNMEKWGIFPENAAKNEDVRHYTEAPSMNVNNGTNNLTECGYYLYVFG